MMHWRAIKKGREDLARAELLNANLRRIVRHLEHSRRTRAVQPQCPDCSASLDCGSSHDYGCAFEAALEDLP